SEISRDSKSRRALIDTLACKADKSACVAYFPVDSRNENLPEKCIHQNCASRPGRYAARDFCCAGAPCLARRREQGGPTPPPSVRRDATGGCRKPRPAPDRCFGVVLYNEYRNFDVSPSNETRTPRAIAGLATAPEGLGGRQPADRPSSVPAWASPPAPASGGVRRRRTNTRAPGRSRRPPAAAVAACTPRCRMGR